MARSNFVLAAIYAGWTADCDLPGDVFRRDLQGLRRLRPGSGCRGWIPGSWRLAASRSRDSRPRCASRRKLGIPGTQDDGTGHRRRNSSSLTLEPPDLRIGGFLRWRRVGQATNRVESLLSAGGTDPMIVKESCPQLLGKPAREFFAFAHRQYRGGLTSQSCPSTPIP